jgi:hypothetical protein
MFLEADRMRSIALTQENLEQAADQGQPPRVDGRELRGRHTGPTRRQVW